MKTGRKMEKNKISKKADSGQQVLSSNEKNIITLRKAKIKELLCIWSFLIIPLINLCIFWVYGTIQSFPIAFEHRFMDGTIKYDFYNFEYLIKTLSEPGNIFGQSILNTLIYWLLGFGFIMPFGFLMAFFLYKRIFGFKFFRFVFFFPSLISSVIIAAFFKYIFGPGGQMPYLWEQIFGIKDVMFFADSRYAFKTLLFYNLYHGLTGQLLYWLAAYARIPEEIVEAGKIDGLSVLKEFRHIAFPLTLPFFSTMMLLNFTGILNAGGPALLLTGGDYGTWDIPFYLYKFTTSGSLNDQGLAGAVGLFKGLIVLPFALLINKLVNRIEPVQY